MHDVVITEIHNFFLINLEVVYIRRSVTNSYSVLSLIEASDQEQQKS